MSPNPTCSELMLKIQELEHDKKRLELALEATEEGMWDFDPSSGVCYFSERYYTMLDYLPNELPAEYATWVSLLHPDDKKRTIDSLQQFLTSPHASFSWEFRMLAKNGDWRWILSRGKGFARDAAGNLTRIVGTHLDITEKKQLEDLLHLTRFIYEKAPIGIIRIERNAVIEDANNQLEYMLGYSREELSSMSVFDIDPTIDKELTEEEWQWLAEQKTFSFETMHQHKDGHKIPVNITTNVLEYEGRQFSISFVEDITERKKHEIELRENEQRLDLALDSANEGIWDWHIDKGNIYLDSRYYSIAGYQPNEFTSTIDEIQKRIHENDLAKVNAIILQYLSGERKSSKIEYRFLRKDGSYMWVQDKGKVVARNAVGNPTRILGTHADISERKEMVESLRLTQSVVDEAPIGIWKIGMNGEIIDVNEEGCSSLGYTREELSRMTIFDVDPRFGIEEWKKRNTKLEQDKVLITETMHRRKNGEVFPILVISKLIHFDDQQIRVAFVQDITERKRTEEALLHSQKMEAIGTLAGGIAHDFNNILSAILGYAQLAELNCSANEKLHKYTTRITEAGLRAKDLVTQILNFSRQHSSEKQPTEISSICKEALKLIRATLPSNIEIQQFWGTTAATINANATQMHQVIVNLCTNAAHAMKSQGGKLAIELIPFEIGVSDRSTFKNLPEGNYLKLIVADTGSGIPREILPRIFEPYFTTKEVGEGTGLGLATVHGIIKDHGGDIKVYSESGIGTTFHVFLPTIGGATLDLNEITKPLVTGTEQILIIDDEKFIVDISQEMLSGLGYTVEIKTDPVDALKTFLSQPDKFGLIITDWTMPKMNGEELIREFKKIRPELPTILCTGFNKRLMPEEASKIEADAVLMKPITMNTLAQTVKMVLDSKK